MIISLLAYALSALLNIIISSCQSVMLTEYESPDPQAQTSAAAPRCKGSLSRPQPRPSGGSSELPCALRHGDESSDSVDPSLLVIDHKGLRGQPVGWVASFGPNAPRVVNSALPIRSFDHFR